MTIEGFDRKARGTRTTLGNPIVGYDRMSGRQSHIKAHFPNPFSMTRDKSKWGREKNRGSILNLDPTET